MRANSKNLTLVVLAVSAFACSRMIFALINDPEGPNLVVVFVTATVLFLISSAAYVSNSYPSLAGFKRSFAAVLIQLVVAGCFFLGLR